MSEQLTDDILDAWGDHLRERRDRLAADVTVPSLHELLASGRDSEPAPLRPIRARGSLRRTIFAAAAVVLLVVGVVALVRPAAQHVTTRPNSAAAALSDAGVPLLFPPGDPSEVDAGLGADRFTTGPDAPTSGASITSYVAGAAGDTLRFFTVIVDRDGPEGTDVMASMTPSGQFQPRAWFDDRTDRGNPENTTFVPVAFEGSSQAIIADSSDRSDILAVAHGTVRVAVYAYGLSTDELTDIGRAMRFGDDGAVDLDDIPEGFAAVTPLAASGQLYPTVNSRSPEGSLDVTPLDMAAFGIAMSLGNTGEPLPEHRVLRPAPDIVLEVGNGDWRRVMGRRDGAWVDLRLDPAGTVTGTNDLLGVFDDLRTVDVATFDAALDRRDRREADDHDEWVADLADTIVERGGWIPTQLPPGARLVSAAEMGFGTNPEGSDGIPGVQTQWNPTTGAMVRFQMTPSTAFDDEEAQMLETTELGDRSVELRSYPAAPGVLIARFPDRSGKSLQVYGTGVDLPTLRSIVASMVELDTGLWSMPPPAGFEPLPGAGPYAPQPYTGPNAIDFSYDTDGSPMSTEQGGTSMPDLTVTVTSVDPAIYGLATDYFFEGGRVERRSDAHGTYYRTARDPGAESGSIMIPGTATRPQVVVTAAGQSDQALLDTARAVAATDEAAVAAFLIPLG